MLKHIQHNRVHASDNIYVSTNSALEYYIKIIVKIVFWHDSQKEQKKTDGKNERTVN